MCSSMYNNKTVAVFRVQRLVTSRVFLSHTKLPTSREGKISYRMISQQPGAIGNCVPICPPKKKRKMFCNEHQKNNNSLFKVNKTKAWQPFDFIQFNNFITSWSSSGHYTLHMHFVFILMFTCTFLWMCI